MNLDLAMLVASCVLCLIQIVIASHEGHSLIQLRSET